MPKKLRADLGGGPHKKKALLESAAACRAIRACTPLRSAWCVRHGRYCIAPVSMIEVAGTPCQDFSSLNQGRSGLSGSRNIFYWVWVRLRRGRQELIWIHENVVGFGIESLQQDLGDLYSIIRVVLCPTSLGWASKRRRQFCIGAHKSLMRLPLCRSPCSSYSLATLDVFLQDVFHRRCEFTHTAYVLDHPLIVEELAAERRWLYERNRKEHDADVPDTF